MHEKCTKIGLDVKAELGMKNGQEISQMKLMQGLNFFGAKGEMQGPNGVKKCLRNVKKVFKS